MPFTDHSLQLLIKVKMLQTCFGAMVICRGHFCRVKLGRGHVCRAY